LADDASLADDVILINGDRDALGVRDVNELHVNVYDVLNDEANDDDFCAINAVQHSHEFRHAFNRSICDVPLMLDDFLSASQLHDDLHALSCVLFHVHDVFHVSGVHDDSLSFHARLITLLFRVDAPDADGNYHEDVHDVS
jgi:hypothetical protein